jgi:hypothetical protein
MQNECESSLEVFILHSAFIILHLMHRLTGLPPGGIMPRYRGRPRMAAGIPQLSPVLPELFRSRIV